MGEESETAVDRSDEMWTSIFNAIPSDIPAGSEPRPLVFHQRAFIADAVYKALREEDYRPYWEDPGLIERDTLT